jgi:hypothetical protein
MVPRAISTSEQFSPTPKGTNQGVIAHLQSAIEEALIYTYTRSDLETVSAEEPRLPWQDRAGAHSRWTPHPGRGPYVSPAFRDAA